MIISALKSSDPKDLRSPIHQDTISALVDLGVEIFFEHGIGEGIFTSDKDFESLGLQSSTREYCIANSDLVISNQPLSSDEVKSMKSGATLLGMVNPFSNQELINCCAESNINLVSMEFIPRITRAQKMDVLSSQANLAGYSAVIESARHLSTALPMMMTAAGTLKPFDTRDVVEEQVNSLGAKFVKIDLGETGQTDQGYAKELTPEQIIKQKDLQSEVCARSDIVITTAQLFGRPAPQLIDNNTINKMKPGSVIFDMAVESGGNVEGSVVDEVVIKNGVKIIGVSNLASSVSGHASLALSNNFNHWICDFYNKDTSSINFDFEDEIVKSSVIAFDGKILNERFQ